MNQFGFHTGRPGHELFHAFSKAHFTFSQQKEYSQLDRYFTSTQNGVICDSLWNYRFISIFSLKPIPIQYNITIYTNFIVFADKDKTVILHRDNNFSNFEWSASPCDYFASGGQKKMVVVR